MTSKLYVSTLQTLHILVDVFGCQVHGWKRYFFLLICETTAKEYYGPVINDPGGSNGCVNMKSVRKECVN